MSSERIGYAQIEVKSIEQPPKSPLRDDLEGTLILGGSEKRFSTTIDSLQPNSTYDAVYERTETLAGESIVKIHEIIEEHAPEGERI